MSNSFPLRVFSLFYLANEFCHCRRQNTTTAQSAPYFTSVALPFLLLLPDTLVLGHSNIATYLGMDITFQNYWRALPIILEAISSAAYVSIDLEFSGVVANKAALHGGRLSLVEAYEEAKAVTEMFQLLQIGITCVVYNGQTSTLDNSRSHLRIC